MTAVTNNAAYGLGDRVAIILCGVLFSLVLGDSLMAQGSVEAHLSDTAPSHRRTIRLADASSGRVHQDQENSEADRGPSDVRTEDLTQRHAVTWVRPEALIEELEWMKRDPLLQSWSAATLLELDELMAQESVASDESAVILTRLIQLKGQLRPILNQVIDDRSQMSEVRNAADRWQIVNRIQRLEYALSRRLDVWGELHQFARREPADVLAGVGGVRVQLASAPSINFGALDPSWSRYLELESLSHAMHEPISELRKAARKTLARLYSPALSTAQSEYLTSVIDENTLTWLKNAACDRIDLSLVLEAVERIEKVDSEKTFQVLNDQYQNLLWSQNPQAARLANVIQLHYRNANVRLTISERLVNRLVPEIPEADEPFRDNIMGASVFGRNRIRNDLLVNFVPDPERIRLQLETRGQVQSRTWARQSGFTINNVGASRYRAVKEVVFDRKGVSSSSINTSSSTNQRVVGMESKYDGIPLVGWVARRVAENKIQQTAPMARQITRNKLESTVGQRFEDEVSSAIQSFRASIYQGVTEPLIALDLEPDALELRTDSEQIVSRFRLAGRDQMAAFTARPVEPPGALLSAQLHESVFNNILNRIDLAGESYTVDGLIEHLSHVFNYNIEPDDANSARDADATFEFAPYDPLRVDFEDGRMTVTINLAKLRVGSGKTWRRITVKAFYYPNIDGTDIVLDQDPNGISLKGHRLRLGDQMALRTIFTVLFKQQIRLSAIPKNLLERMPDSQVELEQFVLADGWLGYAVNDVSVARPAHETRRRLLELLPRR